MSSWPPARRLVAFLAVLGASFGIGLGVGSTGAEVDRTEPVPHDAGHTGDATTSTTRPPAWGPGHDHTSHGDDPTGATP